jgi:LysR family hydrogen peroxide-inducible transcriptional activator
LSAQVAKLEEMLGVELFDRLPREVRLTDAGAELLPELRRILQLSVQLGEAAAHLADPARVTLRIGVIPTIAPYLLPDVVAALTAELPGLTVHWHEARTPEIEARLQSRDLHAGLLGGPPGPAGLVSRALGREPFVLIVPAASAIGPEAVSLDRLEGTRLMLLEEGHCLRDQALDVCMRFDLPEAPFRATSLPTLVQMVGAGGGVTLLPRSAVAPESARAAVREVPLLGISPARTLHLAWHPQARQAALLDDVATRLTRVVTGRFQAA